jgi:hypothetical protein
MKTTLVKQIAQTVEARQNCIKSNNPWADKHKEILNQLNDLLPSGSGIDNGTKIDIETSKPDRLVFNFSYHHMNEGGYYDGWTHHELIVTPSLVHGFNLRITGRDRNQTKEYLYEVYQSALSEVIDFDNETKQYFVPAWRESAKRFQESNAV